MSILIKDMEMPKKPGAYSMKIRLFVREDGTASIWGLEEYIPHEPLDVIPVPPQGRVIDADALCEGRVSNDNVVICAKAAHTIIPAEEGE